jgi:hypothetical protein
MRLLATIIAVLLLAGCGKDDGPAGPDTSPPRVVTTSPTTDQTGVPRDVVISATFSEDIDPWTVSNATFLLSDSIDGQVKYANKVATFTPFADLAYGRTYTATITSAVKDLAGNAMNTDYVWSFTVTWGAIMPLTVGNRWEYRVVTYENPINPLDTTLDTITIVRDTTIGTEQWFIDNEASVLVNRGDGLWRLSDGTPYLFLKYPAVKGDVYAADPAAAESITVAETSIQVTNVIGDPYFCYQYHSIWTDTTVQYDYYYDPNIGPIRIDKFISEPAPTLKERWTLIRMSLQ